MPGKEVRLQTLLNNDVCEIYIPKRSISYSLMDNTGEINVCSQKFVITGLHSRINLAQIVCQGGWNALQAPNSVGKLLSFLLGQLTPTDWLNLIY